MTYDEAIEWMKGNRSTVNNVTCDPMETWYERIARADAAYMEQAYWRIRMRREFGEGR